MKKEILCFGDSNTYGRNPEDGSRFPYEERWPGILSELLGDEYRIIEEGFSGRTIFADNPFFPGKRGLDHIDMILKTHLPLDLIIIMLGTNDAKMIYNASAKDIAYGAGILVDKIRQYNWPVWLDRKPELLLVSPVNILPVGENEKEEAEKSLHFAEYFRKIADSKGTFFLDAALYAKPGSDGLHISAEGHRGLAEALASFLKTSITFG